MKKIFKLNIKIMSFIVFISSTHFVLGSNSEWKVLDINGDFEVANSHNDLPLGWKFWKDPSVKDNSLFEYTKDDSYSGYRALRLINKSAGTISISQENPINIYNNNSQIFYASVYSKTIEVKGMSWVDFTIIDASGEKKWRYATIKTAGNHGWQKYSVSFGVPKNTISVKIQFALRGEGIVLYDNLVIRCRTPRSNELKTINNEQFISAQSEQKNIIKSSLSLFLPQDFDNPWDRRAQIQDSVCTKMINIALGELKSFMIGVIRNSKKDRIFLQATHTGEFFLSDSLIQIQRIHYWDQRRTWNSSDYLNIPELLLSQLHPLFQNDKNLKNLYLVSIKIPATQLPGEYLSEIKIMDNDSKILKKVLLKIKINSFTLVNDYKRWGLFLDSKRWRKYSNSEIIDELCTIKQKGFSHFLLDGPPFTDYYLSNMKVKINLANIANYLELIKRNNLSNEIILSILKLLKYTKLVYKLNNIEVNHTDIILNVKAIISEIIEQSKKNTWPNIIYYVIDEPRTKPEIDQRDALEICKYIQHHGERTFVTMNYSEPMEDRFLEVVDFPCYNKEYVLHTDNQNNRLTKKLKNYHKVLWWYGSGCYLEQEGKILPNRFLSGILFWKSGAKVQFSWTFQRPNSDPYNDFDGRGNMKKDACLVYPALNGGGFVSTLQWHGILEGITDYKYILTLMKYIDTAKGSNSKLIKEKSRIIEQWLEQKKNEFPWLHDGHISNSYLDEFRNAVVQKIRYLSE